MLNLAFFDLLLMKQAAGALYMCMQVPTISSIPEISDHDFEGAVVADTRDTSLQYLAVVPVAAGADL